MDWKTLLNQNFGALIGALIGFLGVLVGLGFTLLYQFIQRKWVIRDNRAKAKHEILLEHLTPIREYVYAILDFVQSSENMNTITVKEMDEESYQYQTLLEKMRESMEKLLPRNAVILAHAFAVNDDELGECYTRFTSLFTTYMTDNEEMKKEKKATYSLYNCSAEILRIIDRLIVEASSGK